MATVSCKTGIIEVAADARGVSPRKRGRERQLPRGNCLELGQDLFRLSLRKREG